MLYLLHIFEIIWNLIQLGLAIAIFIWAWFYTKKHWFKGDTFVAAAVFGCAALLMVFIVYPVGLSFQGAFKSDDGLWSFKSLLERGTSERIWGLGCLNVSAPSRCGVAWNTLYLGLLTATGTVIMGTALALLAERHVRKSSRMQKPMQLLSLLPIITPPFVVGLGLILLFGRAGVVNQGLEYLFGIEPTRWFYGVLGVWFAQMFAFTPIAYMMMRGVVQGVSPSLEEAAQSLRANRSQTFLP
jgi:iron(III) transport system permease protein